MLDARFTHGVGLGVRGDKSRNDGHSIMAILYGTMATDLTIAHFHLNLTFLPLLLVLLHLIFLFTLLPFAARFVFVNVVVIFMLFWRWHINNRGHKLAMPD